MDYHSDRFEDHSLMVFHNEKLLAILPSNIKKETLYSHQGLTYGGFVIGQDLQRSEYMTVIKSIFHYLEVQKIGHLSVRAMPSIYHDQQAEEFNHAVALLEADTVHVDHLSCIDMKRKPSFSRSRKEGVRRGLKHGLVVAEIEDPELFWKELLLPNLSERFGVKPLHSLEEIKLLKRRFPKKIRCFGAFHERKIVAGTLIFETKFVAKAQYIAGDENRNRLGSIDYLFDRLLNDTFEEKPYFDLGTSKQVNGEDVNEGLLFWKEGLGARNVVQKQYRFDTSKHKVLDTSIR